MPGGGISPDGERWVSCRDGFFFPVRVLSRLFRRLFLERLAAAYHARGLNFFGNQTALADPKAFEDHLAPLRKTEWVVYAKPPFGGSRGPVRRRHRRNQRVTLMEHRKGARLQLPAGEVDHRVHRGEDEACNNGRCNQARVRCRRGTLNVRLREMHHNA